MKLADCVVTVAVAGLLCLLTADGCSMRDAGRTRATVVAKTHAAASDSTGVGVGPDGKSSS